MRVCANGATADSLLRAFLADLPAKGWQASKTYPYNEDSASACGDPYCWRKAAAGDVRYVSLESMSVATGAVAFTLRFASAPQPSASLVIHSSITRTTYTPFGLLSASASCSAGEQMVSGGYNITSADHGYSPYANFPSSPNTWTATVKAASAASYNLQTYVGCLRANYPLAMKIVTARCGCREGRLAGRHSELSGWKRCNRWRILALSSGRRGFHHRAGFRPERVDCRGDGQRRRAEGDDLCALRHTQSCRRAGVQAPVQHFQSERFRAAVH